jgi:octaprenyl-diphosphate synthase
VAIAFAKGDESEKAFWRRVLETDDRREGDFAEAMRLLRRHDAIDLTIRRAETYGEQARRALDRFPPCEEREAMLELVDFCIERAY